MSTPSTSLFSLISFFFASFFSFFLFFHFSFFTSHIFPFILFFLSFFFLFFFLSIFEQPPLFVPTNCPVGWGCRRVRPPNEWPGYDTKQSDGEVPVMFEALGNAEHPFIVIAPRSTLARRGSTWKCPIYGLNRTNGILMLNWIVWLNWIAWNRNVFDKPQLHLNWVLMLNWNVWNITVFDIENVLTLNWFI